MELPVRAFIRNPFDQSPVSGIPCTRMPGTLIDLLSPVRLRRLHTRWALAAVLVLAVGAVPLSAGELSLAQRHESRHEIDQLEDEWRIAVLNSDAKTMDSLLADDYMGITAAGTLQSRDLALQNMRSGRVHFASLTITDRKVRFYGATAVVTSLATINATNSEGPVTGDYRYTRVYVRNAQGVWKVVSFEASHVRTGPHRRNEFH